MLEHLFENEIMSALEFHILSSFEVFCCKIMKKDLYACKRVPQHVGAPLHFFSLKCSFCKLGDSKKGVFLRNGYKVTKVTSNFEKSAKAIYYYILIISCNY